MSAASLALVLEELQSAPLEKRQHLQHLVSRAFEAAGDPSAWSDYWQLPKPTRSMVSAAYAVWLCRAGQVAYGPLVQ